MASRPVHGLALCVGIGGLELGIGLACDHLGWGYRMVGAVERDAYAAAVLVARMEDQTLDQAPVWDDLATFDAGPWAGRVDLVSAGLPCQPFSQAGARAGLDDPRHLWPHARRIITALRPRFVFLENVPDVVRAGWLAVVLADLATLGFDAEWEVLGADDCGAPHRRKRFWLLAWQADTDGSGRDGRAPDEGRSAVGRVPAARSGDPHVAYRDGGGCEGVEELGAGAQGRVDGDVDGPGGTPMADPRSVRRGLLGDTGAVREAGRDVEGAVRERERGGDVPRDGGADVADPDGSGRHPGLRPDPRPGTGTEPQRRSPFPPGPDDLDGWARWVAEGGPQPSVRRGPDGIPARLERLHSLGNGVVPLVAATAFVRLARRAGLIGEG